MMKSSLVRNCPFRFACHLNDFFFRLSFIFFFHFTVSFGGAWMSLFIIIVYVTVWQLAPPILLKTLKSFVIIFFWQRFWTMPFLMKTTTKWSWSKTLKCFPCANIIWYRSSVKCPSVICPTAKFLDCPNWPGLLFIWISNFEWNKI